MSNTIAIKNPGENPGARER